ncbi:MAG: serine hydrolase domain-containing protein [Pseudomonadota bacterium]
MRDAGVEAGSIAVFQDGVLAATDGIRRDPEDPYPLLSNSKAIAAICLDTLVEDGLVSWEDTAAEHLDGLIGAFGPGAEAITLQQLATHSSGISVDATQAAMLGWLDETGLRHDLIAKVALSRGIKAEDSGRFHYSNENYAILGAVLDRITGDTNTACLERTFGAAGAVAERDPTFGSTLAWAGWRASAVEYGRFAWHAFGPEADQDMPSVQESPEWLYGLGVNISGAGSAFEMGHFGQYCGVDRVDAGAYFGLFEDGWLVSANYSGCPDFDDLDALSDAMKEIAGQP